ncbi:MAG: type II secretion system protein [Sulfuricella sp.]
MSVAAPAHRLKFTTPCRSSGGFTYLGVLFAVVFMGVAMAATGTVWHQTRQREKERELLFVGGQFRQALDLYYQNPPPGKVKKFPQKLEDLLRDDRYPDVRRYLRRIYRDPMTGGTEWGLLRGAGKGIVGIYSLSDEVPVKTANFEKADAALADKRHYYQWQFVATNGAVATAPAANSAAAGATGDASAPGSATPAPGSPDSAQTAAPAPADIQQNPPAAARDPSPPNELPPDEQRSVQCNSALIRARTACFAIARKSGMDSASGCFQSASTQYTQCMK